jgi:hypothetical protein
METFLTRAITLVALICLLVVGAAATSILGRDSVPAARYEMAASAIETPVVSNKEGKKDRLAIATLALASFEPPQAQVQAQAEPQAQTQPQTSVLLPEPLRQAYAASSSGDIVMPKLAEPAAKPKVASKPQPQPQPQKNYALLSDVQIAGIKERLKLSSDQESYWPPVESALRAVARKIHAKRQVDPSSTSLPIDPESEEVQQLKSAAMPLLFQLREDQKSEVRSLARIIGLDKVAAMI